jgi:integrase
MASREIDVQQALPPEPGHLSLDGLIEKDPETGEPSTKEVEGPLQDYISELLRDEHEPISGNTAKNIVVQASLFLDYCVVRRWIPANYLKGRWKQFTGTMTKCRKPAPRMASNAVLAFAQGPKPNEKGLTATSWMVMRMLAYTIIYTGCRIAEACGLRWENINFTRMSVNLCEQYQPDARFPARSQRETKGDRMSRKRNRSGEERNNWIPLDPELAAQLVAHAQATGVKFPGTGYVITGRKGQPITPQNAKSAYWGRLLWLVSPELADKNPMPSGGYWYKPRYSAHTFRHWNVTEQVLAGEAIAGLKNARHATTDFTIKAYASWAGVNERLQRPGMEAIARALQPSSLLTPEMRQNGAMVIEGTAETVEIAPQPPSEREIMVAERSARIRELLAQGNLKGGQIAEIVGCSQSEVSRVRNGKTGV